ncbi:hypothetical protein MG293_001719 [Ovis ammon polii]|uniref:Uncharacterized protein n=1 Tax=Ovis ammon polii TaxID=230172 RepID=A0AAD4UQJ0_OVIAM|nr:hypothetical protein MG293_001719 [Ovis ammon polii]
MDCSLPGCSVHGIFQARVLEWGPIAFSVELILVYDVRWLSGKESSYQQEIWIRSLDKEDPLKRKMAIQSPILAREIPWTEELAGYSPKDLKELDMTK